MFSGWQKTAGRTFGFLAKLDTALNVVWTYRHPPQATFAFVPQQVYELADGMLVWLGADGISNTLGGQPTPYLYVVRVSAGGQQRVSSAGCGVLSPYAWQPLAGGGALVVGTASMCAPTPGAYPAYVARLDHATLLAATAPAELVLPDVLGQVVRRVAVAGRGDLVTQALTLHGLAPGTYACRLLVAGQPSGGACRLVVVP